MRRSLIAVLVLIAVPGAARAAGSTPSAPRASLQEFGCRRAPDAIDRVISVVAVMRPQTGTRAMALKFDLLRWIPRDQQFVLVKGGDLGRWRHPLDPRLGQQPGDVWRLKKVVADLAAPAKYRFRVIFRWTGPDLQARTVLFSRLCEE